MSNIDKLRHIWQHATHPFIVGTSGELHFSDIESATLGDLSDVRPGDIVALIGDFEPASIARLLHLIELNAIVVPLTVETRAQHEYFFESAFVDLVIEGGKVSRRDHGNKHPLIEALRSTGHAGLVLFSTGTTGRPKAILHDMTLFLRRFETPRPTLRTLSFLLFDHIGGINTLLHTLFNRGVVISPSARTVSAILKAARDYRAEVLPATPTFLRMLLMSGALPEEVPPSLTLITYGTERMDQPTLDELCRLLPGVDFRQTFGMSELGIVRVKSLSRNSLFMKIGGEGVETRIASNSVLEIRSNTRMLGYLNADSPFDAEGWYNTKDIVESKGDYFRVVGRTSEVINMGGLKFMASEVERVALAYPGVSLVSVYARPNPFTGQHVEMTVQLKEGSSLTKEELSNYLKSQLQAHMIPRKLVFGLVAVGHRFKKA